MSIKVYLVLLMIICFSIFAYSKKSDQGFGNDYQKIKKNYAGGIDEDDLEVQESLVVPEKSVNLHSIQQSLIKDHKGESNE